MCGGDQPADRAVATVESLPAPGLNASVKAIGAGTTTVTVRLLNEDGEEITGASFSSVVSAFTPLIGGAIGDGGLGIETVDGGLEITATETGRAEITITSEDAEPAILLVGVCQRVTSLEVSPSSVSLAVGETTTLSARVLDPNGHDIQQAGPGMAGLVVHWKTSDSAVAMVDGSDGREDSETGSSATVTASWARSFFGTATVTVTE